MSAFHRLTCSMAVFIGLAGPAAAADLVAPEEPVTEPGWEFVFAPYFWAAGMKGDVAAFGAPEVEVDLSFSDILEHFDIGVMGVGEARNDRFGILTDLMYIKLSGDSEVSAHHIDADIKLTTEMLTLLGAVEYRLFEGEGGSFDVLAGGRLWWVNNDLDFDGAAINVSANDSETWVDPIVGVRGRVNLSPDFFFTGWGMIGGFGVASEFFWDAMGGLGYQVSDSFDLVAGYRGLSVDYKNDGFVLDVVEHGPILGAVFRF